MPSRRPERDSATVSCTWLWNTGEKCIDNVWTYAIGAFQFTEYQTFTIHGLASWARPSRFAISTQGVRHLALVLSAASSWLVVLLASGSSLETQDRTSRGLDLEAAGGLSIARIWAASNSPLPVEDTLVRCCSFNIQFAWCDMLVAPEQKFQTGVLSHLSQSLHWLHRWNPPPPGTLAGLEEQGYRLGILSHLFLQR